MIRSFCKRCGIIRSRDAKFCTKCGRPTEPLSDGTSSSSNARVSREAILVAAARCKAKKMPFAIRFEEHSSGIWLACSAYVISERRLSNPAFSNSQVTTSALSSDYPGCPHCGSDPRKELAGITFIKCSCGKLACSTGVIGSEALCPWCDRVGTVGRPRSFQVFGIRDR